MQEFPRDTEFSGCTVLERQKIPRVLLVALKRDDEQLLCLFLFLFVCLFVCLFADCVMLYILLNLQQQLTTYYYLLLLHNSEDHFHFYLFTIRTCTCVLCIYQQYHAKLFLKSNAKCSDCKTGFQNTMRK